MDLMAKGPIYKIANEVADKNLYDQLVQAMERLKETMIPRQDITRLGKIVGYGVDKAQRSIAADAVISIAKQIKARPGW
jgi:hypothetical protein